MPPGTVGAPRHITVVVSHQANYDSNQEFEYFGICNSLFVIF